jgi:hypothetical protein
LNCQDVAQQCSAVAGVWRHRVPELPDDPPRVFPIPQAVQDKHEHDPDRLAEVEQVAYLWSLSTCSVPADPL